MLRYAITEGLLTAGGDYRPLISRCEKLGRDGVEFLLLREKALGAGDLAALARQVIQAVDGTGMRVIVPGSAEVALAAGADGVHLSGGAGEVAVGRARAAFPGAWVSVSCHSIEEVRRAREDGASAVLFAPVFGKTVGGVEVVRGVGLERLREACAAAAAEVPVFALGGVIPENAVECARVGARGVAGIRMFFGK